MVYWRYAVTLAGFTVGLLSPLQSEATDIASDDFRHGLDQWKVEQQDVSGSVIAKDGVLDIISPAGVTIWFRQKLQGDYEIHFTATPVPVSFPNLPERISDLNLFWNATTAEGSDPTTLNLDGALNSYNPLHLYYVGFGANGNKTTRLRRYDGSSARPQIQGYADKGEATPADALGAPPPFARLTANAPVEIKVISRTATPEDESTLKFYANKILVFSGCDPAAYLEGWFALRTTTSHFKISDFRVIPYSASELLLNN